ncbi:MAG: hypothetical protein U0452_10845 [Anaerolineae bacterium]
MSIPPNDDPVSELIARWEARMAEASTRSRQTKTADLQAAYYFRGVAETYRTALAELNALLGEPEAPEPPALKLKMVSEEAVQKLLVRLGLFPRTLRRHEDGAFTVIFSRLQPISSARRTELLLGANPRLRILHEGTLQDTGDPFIEIGFLDDED